jgi:biopolymer transport protein TolR
MGLSVGRARGVRSDINVTPLIDVVLVLLIIFLVTMPIMMRQISIEVPPEAPPDVLVPEAPLAVMVHADLSVTVTSGGRDTTVAGTDLASALREAMASKTGDRTVFVDFEDPVPWRETVAAMDTVRGVARGQSGDVALAMKVRETSAP